MCVCKWEWQSMQMSINISAQSGGGAFHSGLTDVRPKLIYENSP